MTTPIEQNMFSENPNRDFANTQRGRGIICKIQSQCRASSHWLYIPSQNPWEV